jgi:hypothetical protein
MRDAMGLAISNSLAGAASTAAGAPDFVGISVLKKAMGAEADQNAQLLSSIPKTPGPVGKNVDLYA